MKIFVHSIENIKASQNYKNATKELENYLSIEEISSIEIDRRDGEKVIIKFISGNELIMEGSEGYLIINYKDIEY